MGETQKPKDAAAEIGRTGLYRTVTQSAGMNRMEAQYRKVLLDLKVREAYEGMATEVQLLPEGEKLAEILSRFIVVLLMQTHPQQQGAILWQLYTHLRSTGLIEAVKPNIGTLVDLTGRRIPPKEGT